MNKLLIISDSHGLTTELNSIRARHTDVDMALHCGDSELLMDSPYLEDYVVVRGNCDYNVPFMDENVLEVGGLRIYMTHGHLFGVKQSLMTLQYASLEKEADIVCFGHSHIAFAEQFNQQLFINPGSIKLPKKFSIPSYVILNWMDKKNIYITFYEVDGKEISQFPYQKRFHLK